MCHPEVPPGTRPPDVRTEEATFRVGDERMPSFVALPERTPAPAVLVVNDVFGRSAFYEHVARRLAQAGFVAATPEFFFREGPLGEPTREAAMARAKRLDFSRTIDDMSAGIDWLRDRPETTGTVGTIGFCMGGTIVLLLAARRQDLAASVCYYGFPADARTPARPIDVAARMKGPILGQWGDQDAGVGMDNVAALDAALSAAGVDHEFHVYPVSATPFSRPRSRTRARPATGRRASPGQGRSRSFASRSPRSRTAADDAADTQVRRPKMGPFGARSVAGTTVRRRARARAVAAGRSEGDPG